jgi:hypothetical protein
MFFFLFDEPLKGSKSLKIFKISLTFRFDKLWQLSKSVHTGENSQILTVSNKTKKSLVRFMWQLSRTDDDVRKVNNCSSGDDHAANQNSGDFHFCACSISLFDEKIRKTKQNKQLFNKQFTS